MRLRNLFVPLPYDAIYAYWTEHMYSNSSAIKPNIIKSMQCHDKIIKKSVKHFDHDQ